jgi:poly(beta-D-mannuronate) lyase
MERHEMAVHYQSFAIEPLVMIAELASRQGIDLYGYQKHGRSLKSAVAFFEAAVNEVVTKLS